jgi:CRISPR-associated protein Cas2
LPFAFVTLQFISESHIGFYFLLLPHAHTWGFTLIPASRVKNLLFTFYFLLFMFMLITYDVATSSKGGQRRLRRIAQACKDYGQRVQNSVFECLIEQKHWVVLRERLLREINTQEDSLRFYFLDADCLIEHHGCKQPIDFEEPLIL